MSYASHAAVWVEPGKFVRIYDRGGEIVSWTDDEWTEDPMAVTATVNAVLMAKLEGAEKLRKTIHLPALEPDEFNQEELHTLAEENPEVFNQLHLPCDGCGDDATDILPTLELVCDICKTIAELETH